MDTGKSLRWPQWRTLNAATFLHSCGVATPNASRATSHRPRLVWGCGGGQWIASRSVGDDTPQCDSRAVGSVDAGGTLSCMSPRWTRLTPLHSCELRDCASHADALPALTSETAETPEPTAATRLHLGRGGSYFFFYLKQLYLVSFIMYLTCILSCVNLLSCTLSCIVYCVSCVMYAAVGRRDGSGMGGESDGRSGRRCCVLWQERQQWGRRWDGRWERRTAGATVGATAGAAVVWRGWPAHSTAHRILRSFSGRLSGVAPSLPSLPSLRLRNFSGLLSGAVAAIPTAPASA